MNFSDFLHLDGYIPVYGSTITPESFHPVDVNAWEVTAWDAPGHEVTYRVEVDGAVARYFVDGAEVEFFDIHSGARRVPTPQDVFDAISYGDGKHRTEARVMATWAGEDIDAMLKRAEHGVVRATDVDVNPSRFASARAFEDEVNRLLAGTPMRVRVHQVNVWPSFRAEYAISHYIVSGEEDRYCGFGYGTDTAQAEWSARINQLPQPPYITARYDGTTPLYYAADYAYRYTLVPEAFLGEQGTAESWWLLAVPDVDASLLVPTTSSILQVATDDDGQMVTLMLHDAAHRARSNALEDSFHRRHGVLLDDSLPADSPEVTAAIDAALGTIAGA